MLHKPNNNNIIQALAAIQHTRIETQYAKTVSRYSSPSTYKGKVMEYIEMMAFVTIANKGYGEIVSQHYTYANVVTDDETGNVMDLKKLLKDPKYIKIWSRSTSNEYGRLFQDCGRTEDGAQRIEGTNTYYWITKAQVPKIKITYARAVV